MLEARVAEMMQKQIGDHAIDRLRLLKPLKNVRSNRSRPPAQFQKRILGRRRQNLLLIDDDNFPSVPHWTDGLEHAEQKRAVATAQIDQAPFRQLIVNCEEMATQNFAMTEKAIDSAQVAPRTESPGIIGGQTIEPLRFEDPFHRLTDRGLTPSQRADPPRAEFRAS